MTGRIICFSVLILMLSHKTNAGGCRNGKYCSHRPKPTTTQQVGETTKPKYVTTVKYNLSTPSIVNESSSEQITQEHITVPSSTIKSSPAMEQSTAVEPSTVTEPFITIQSSTGVEPSTTIEPTIAMEPFTITEESSEEVTEYTDDEESTSVASCTEVLSTTESLSTTEIPCELSTDSDLEEVDDNKGGPIAKCPDQNGIESVFLADSKDCSIFYMCNWGQPNKMKCPGGLHFSTTLNVCDWPHSAGCKV